MKISYEEYDRLEDICLELHEKLKKDENYGIYEYRAAWPHEEEMKECDIPAHFEDFFKYLFFWYTVDIMEELQGDNDALLEYKKMLKYIRKIMNENVEFVDG